MMSLYDSWKSYMYIAISCFHGNHCPTHEGIGTSLVGKQIQKISWKWINAATPLEVIYLFLSIFDLHVYVAMRSIISLMWRKANIRAGAGMSITFFLQDAATDGTPTYPGVQLVTIMSSLTQDLKKSSSKVLENVLKISAVMTYMFFSRGILLADCALPFHSVHISIQYN